MRALLLFFLVILAVPATAQEIKLASWNIAWLTTKPSGHPDLPRDLTTRTEQDFARLRAYAERLAPDVVALQEVDGPLSIAGMAFQNPTLLPWRNILDNVMLPLEVVQPHRGQLRAKRAEYEAQARELLALVGLNGFEAKFPWQLSGGMQQRASLCRALIHQPRLLMLDEPFGALDIFTREDLWAVLQKLWLARRPTVILVTHDLREAAYLADRVLVMSSRPGRIIAERRVDFPRERTMETTYTTEFQDLVHELRDRISDARDAEEIVDAP